MIRNPFLAVGAGFLQISGFHYRLALLNLELPLERNIAVWIGYHCITNISTDMKSTDTGEFFTQ